MDPDQKSESTESAGRIEFPAPQGFSIPSGSEPGKPFDVVCSFEVKEDGKTLCMTKIGESDAPGYGANADKGESDDGKPDYKPMASKMVNEMNTAGVPDPGY